jgi:hypothetical protein
MSGMPYLSQPQRIIAFWLPHPIEERQRKALLDRPLKAVAIGAREARSSASREQVKPGKSRAETFHFFGCAVVRAVVDDEHRGFRHRSKDVVDVRSDVLSFSVGVITIAFASELMETDVLV